MPIHKDHQLQIYYSKSMLYAPFKAGYGPPITPRRVFHIMSPKHLIFRAIEGRDIDRIC